MYISVDCSTVYNREKEGNTIKIQLGHELGCCCLKCLEMITSYKVVTIFFKTHVLSQVTPEIAANLLFLSWDHTAA